MIITQVLNDFIKCWVAFGYRGESVNEDLVKKINSGECGLAALTVHYVLKERFNIETAILSNRSHCWLGFEKKDYDTMYPAGYPEEKDANQVWSKGGIDNVNRDTFSDSCEIWMPCGSHGAYLFKGFVERYELELPNEIQQLINGAPENEFPEIVDVLMEYENEVSKIPLPASIEHLG